MSLVPVESPSTPPQTGFSAMPKISSNEPFQRTSEARIEDLPGKLPTAHIDDSVDHVAIAEACVKNLNTLTSANLAQDALWRDVFALTGTLRTFSDTQSITATWAALIEYHKMTNFELMPNTAQVVRVGPTHSWIAARFTFSTSGSPAAYCSGQIGIVPVGKAWKVWMMTTILEAFKEFPNPDFVTDSGSASTKTNHDNLFDYEAIVVGGGFAGLCVAARLKAMGVHYLMLDRNARIGDSWRNRYDSLRFHTTKYFGDTPLESTFKDGYEYFPSAKDVARGYSDFADKHQLNTSLSTTFEAVDFDQDSNIWTVTFTKCGQRSRLRTRNVVFAIGSGGSVPVWPQLKDREAFKGTLLHSSSYKNAHEWTGKKGVVIGTANTAHDVADDMLTAGMSVTMVQRGRTSVAPLRYYLQWAETLYNETIPLEEADRQSMATPLAITRQLSLFGQRYMAAQEPDRFDSLERRGFRCERNADLWKLLSERLGGHYLDVGVSQKISDGLIKMKSDAKLTGLRENGLVFNDGSTLDADVIVVCTGFKLDMLGEVSKFVGPKIAERLDHYWGVDSEGELRGAFKPLSYPGIYYTGGGVTHARFYSRFIALQIKAALAGTPLRLYSKQESSHVLQASQSSNGTSSSDDPDSEVDSN